MLDPFSLLNSYSCSPRIEIRNTVPRPSQRKTFTKFLYPSTPEPLTSSAGSPSPVVQQSAGKTFEYNRA
jgi:hypothetical protein